MLLVELNELKDETIVQIGKDLKILPLDAEISLSNVNEVVSNLWFSLDICLPKRVLSGNIDRHDNLQL